MILTPNDTNTTVNPDGTESVDLYYSVPMGDDWSKDLQDTITSLSNYLAGSGYKITDSGQTTDGGVYITYLKSSVTPASTTGSFAATVGQQTTLSKIGDAVSNTIISVGKAVNGNGSLSNTGSFSDTLSAFLKMVGTDIFIFGLLALAIYLLVRQVAK